MAHYDLEEQEQIDELKAWWKQYGNLVTGLVMAVALAVAGWQGWNLYRNQQAGQSAAVFAALEEALAANDPQRIKTLAGELTERYAGTTQAALGALMAAKVSFDAGDLKTAKLQLTWVVEKGKNEIRDIARLRLVALLLDEKEFGEALKQLEEQHASAFDVRFAELKGEVLVAQGKKAEARQAFKAAIAGLEAKETARGRMQTTRSIYRELLQQKLDALGESA